MPQDNKEFTDTKFLDKVKDAALNHRDDAVPYSRPDLYSAMMWTRGMLDVLSSKGYKIVKENE